MGDAFSDSDPDRYRREQEFTRKKEAEDTRRNEWLRKFWPSVPIGYTGNQKSMYLVPLATGDTILCSQHIEGCFAMRAYDSVNTYFQEREHLLEKERIEKLRQNALSLS